MIEIPTNEPTELRAGLTWQWRREDLTDYPASQWTLTYWFKQRGTGGGNFSKAAVPDGDHFAVTIDATTSATYAAGDWTWTAIVTKGTEAFEVDRDALTILPRYDQPVALDDRSHARKVLAALEAVIEKKATRDQMSYAIGGRQLSRMKPEEILMWREKYKGYVADEEAAAKVAAGLPNPKNVGIRLTRV